MSIHALRKEEVPEDVGRRSRGDPWDRSLRVVPEQVGRRSLRYPRMVGRRFMRTRRCPEDGWGAVRERCLRMAPEEVPCGWLGRGS